MARVIGAYAAIGAFGGALFGYAVARSHSKWTYWQWEAVFVLSACTLISATLLGALVDRRGRGGHAKLVVGWATFAAGAFNGALVLVAEALMHGDLRAPKLEMVIVALVAGAVAAIPFFPATLAVAAVADAVTGRADSLAESSQARGTYRAVAISASVATMLMPAHADHSLLVHVPLWIAGAAALSLVLLLALERRTSSRIALARPTARWERHDVVPTLAIETGLAQLVDHGVGDEVWAHTRNDSTYRAPAGPIAVIRGDPNAARVINAGAQRTTWAAMGIALVALIEQVALR